jgi:hypothetical protein
MKKELVEKLIEISKEISKDKFAGNESAIIMFVQNNELSVSFGGEGETVVAMIATLMKMDDNFYNAIKVAVKLTEDGED